MAALVGREDEMLAQLRALLFSPDLPAPAPATPAAVAAPAVVFKAETAAGPPLAAIMCSGGRGPAASSAAAMTTAADASSCGGSGGGCRRPRRHGSKRDRVDDERKAKDDDEQQLDEEEPAAAAYSPPCCKRRKKKQQSSKFIVTSEPDFDGYQWRKYGQKQIEGAMYPRSYYRCTRSTEQGCQAKRTVQRNDDGGDAATAAPEYTVVYVAEHTCAANDSLEAPVILETTNIVIPSPSTTAANGKRQPQEEDNTRTDNIVVPTMSGGSCSTTTTTAATIITTTGTESPAISGDDITCRSSNGASIGTYDYTDNYYSSELFATTHGDGWATTSRSVDAVSLQEMEDLSGPIRSPVHIPTPGWSIDQLLLQLVNEPLLCQF